MSSAKARTKVESKAREEVIAEENACAKTLLVAYDKLVARTRENLWEFVDEFVRQRIYYGFSFQRTASILRKAIADRKALGWKGKSDDEEYSQASNFYTKIIKVASHPTYDFTYRKNGKSVWQAYNEITTEENSKKANMSMEGREKRATKANNYLNEKMDRRKKLLAKKRETEAWVAPAFDADREWRKATWEIVVGEPVLFNRYMAHIARKRPQEFTAMLRYVVESDALPEDIEIVIH